MHIVFLGNKLFYRFKVCPFKRLLMQRIMVETAHFAILFFLSLARSFYIIRKVFQLLGALLPKRIDVDIFCVHSLGVVPVSSTTKADMRSNLFRQTEVLNTQRVMLESLFLFVIHSVSAKYFIFMSFFFCCCQCVYVSSFTIFNFNRC